MILLWKARSDHWIEDGCEGHASIWHERRSQEAGRETTCCSLGEKSWSLEKKVVLEMVRGNLFYPCIWLVHQLLQILDLLLLLLPLFLVPFQPSSLSGSPHNTVRAVLPEWESFPDENALVLCGFLSTLQGQLLSRFLKGSSLETHSPQTSLSGISDVFAVHIGGLLWVQKAWKHSFLSYGQPDKGVLHCSSPLLTVSQKPFQTPRHCPMESDLDAPLLLFSHQVVSDFLWPRGL